MESFVDRLGDFLRSLFGDDRDRRGALRDLGAVRADSAILISRKRGRSWTTTCARGPTAPRAPNEQRASSREQRPPDPRLRQDYANLEVPFGADIETVRKSYKTLMMKYHPDKHAGDPEKQSVALEITKKINESFERIRSRHES